MLMFISIDSFARSFVSCFW